MDIVNKEGCQLYDKTLPGPPTLTEWTLDFGRVFRGSQKTLQQIITNTTTQPMIWLAHTGESKWLSLEPDHGILQPGERQPIRVTVSTSTLEAGEHSVTLIFSSEGDETSMSRNTISKVKVEEAPMRAGPSTSLPLQAGLHLGWLTPQSTHTMGLVISNPDSRPIDWAIQIGSDRPGIGNRVHFDHLENPTGHREDFDIAQHNGLILTPAQGSLNPGEAITIYVTANAASSKFESGYSYTTPLTLTSKVRGLAKAASTSVQLPITFDVSARPYNDGGPKVPAGVPPNPGISFTIPKGSSEGTTTLSFTNSDSSMVYWTLNPDPGTGWLTVNPSSGHFNAGQQATVTLTAKRAGLQVGPHTTNLHLLLSFSPVMGSPVIKAPLIPVTVTVE